MTLKKVAWILCLLITQGVVGEMTLPEFDTLWDYYKPAQTRAKFEEILGSGAIEEGSSYQLELLTQIARTFSLERNFEQAHRTLDKVEGYLEEATPVVAVRYGLERGRSFNSAGDKKQAISYFEKAYNLSHTIAELDFFTVDAAHMMAIALEEREVKRKWNHKAISIAESSKSERAQGWLGSLYNNLGWDYHDVGMFLKALPLFEDALRFHSAKGSPQSVFIAKWTVARCLRSLKRYEDAFKIQNTLKVEMERDQKPDGYVYEELAELAFAQENRQEAAQFFALAFNLLSQDSWLVANEADRLERMRKLSVGEEL